MLQYARLGNIWCVLIRRQLTAILGSIHALEVRIVLPTTTILFLYSLSHNSVYQPGKATIKQFGGNCLMPKSKISKVKNVLASIIPRKKVHS